MGAEQENLFLPLSPLNPAYYGGQVAQERGLASLPPGVVNPTMEQSAQGPNYFQGGMLTYEIPIVEFPGDVAVPASTDVTYKAGDNVLPNNPVSITFTQVVGAPYYSINGGGPRLMLNNSGYSGVRIRTLQIVTGAADSCVFSTLGTGI